MSTTNAASILEFSDMAGLLSNLVYDEYSQFCIKYCIVSILI